MRIKTEILIERYRDRVFAAAFSVCRNAEDADDIVQETFIAYHTSVKEFDSEEHIKAWLLRVAFNKAKNLTRSFWHRNAVPLEDYMETLEFESGDSREIFRAVMELPEKYRTAVHLFYFEDYSMKEIAAVLAISESAVKVRLNRARNMLRESLGEVWNND